LHNSVKVPYCSILTDFPGGGAVLFEASQVSPAYPSDKSSIKIKTVQSISEINGENRSTGGKKTGPSAILLSSNPTWTYRGTNLVIRAEAGHVIYSKKIYFLTENTVRLHHKDQPVDTVQGNNHCLL